MLFTYYSMFKAIVLLYSALVSWFCLWSSLSIFV